MTKKHEEDTRLTSNGFKPDGRYVKNGKTVFKIVGIPAVVVMIISGAVKGWMYNKALTEENARELVEQVETTDSHDTRIVDNAEDIQDNSKDIALMGQREQDIKGQLSMIREEIKANRVEQREDMAEIRSLIIESRGP